MTIEREDSLPEQAEQNTQVTEGNSPDASSTPAAEAEVLTVQPNDQNTETSDLILVEATAPPAEEALTTTEEAPERRKPWGKIAGASAAVVSIVGGSIFLLNRGESNDSDTLPAAPVATAEATTPTEPEISIVVPATQAPAPTTTEATAATTPTTEATSGSEVPAETTEMLLNGTVTFDHLGNLSAGIDPIMTTQPNGEPLEVPRLDPSSPESLTKTALNLLACYVSMGEEACKSALTDGTAPGNQVEELRMNLRSGRDPDSKAQLALFSNPQNPAIFTVYTENRQTVVQLTGGELYVERIVDNFGANDWQGEWTREFASQGGVDLVATELMMTFRQEDEDGWSATGKPVMSHFRYGFTNAR